MFLKPNQIPELKSNDTPYQFQELVDELRIFKYSLHLNTTEKHLYKQRYLGNNLNFE